MYGIVVAVTVFAHFLFIGYVVIGGFLALRWPHTIGLHVAAVLWAVVSAAGCVGCPLTGLERWARHRAGMQPLTSKGFIAHYITGILYPADWVVAVQVLVFLIVATTWARYVWRDRRHDLNGYDADRRISSSGEL
jgi:Protein of Unknown function (DUF2784)